MSAERPSHDPARLIGMQRVGAGVLLGALVITLAVPFILLESGIRSRQSRPSATIGHDSAATDGDADRIRGDEHADIALESPPPGIAPVRPSADTTVEKGGFKASPPEVPEPPSPDSDESILARQAEASVPATAALPPARALNRTAADREKRIREFGGTRGTETAVEAGLAWLAAHQEPDGSWNRFDFPGRCPRHDRCSGVPVVRTEANLTPGITGLALLAFLGAGNTDRDGAYQRIVRSGIQALVSFQQPHGGFGGEESNAGYNDSVATFALAEFYSMTGEPSLRAPLERALGRLAATQQALGGWDYLPRPDTGRNDSSITAWAVQALQAASVAGLPLPSSLMVKAALHFARAAQDDGRVWYADAGTGFALDSQSMRPSYRYGPAMLAVGLTCEQLLGWRTDAALPRKQAALIFSEMPSGAAFQGGDASGLHSEYYWYYGTICMFQLGGPQWERWNSRMRDALLPLQCRATLGDGSRSHEYGSFPPFGQGWGQWGRVGGRVYSTAINVLTLEIYYRHTPTYLEAHQAVTSADWRAFTAGAEPRMRLSSAQLLSEMQLQVGEPVLRELLEFPDLTVAATAAQGLANLDSPLGIPVLEQACRQLGANWRAILTPALQKARAVAAQPGVSGVVRLVDKQRRLATLDLPRAFVGMRLCVERDGRRLGELEVVQRYSGRQVVVAELGAGWENELPHAGDAVVSR